VTLGATAIPEVQALLRAFAAGRDVAEMGAAFGETAAVMAETARSVVAVELDPERIPLARERLDRLANVELLVGDAFELLCRRAPFGLVFADGGLRPVTKAKWEAILGFVEPGGIIVKDDLTPGRPVDGDETREFLLRDPRLAGVELLATPAEAVIVAVRR
jgi:predicted O-methyltransferase YrrM